MRPSVFTTGSNLNIFLLVSVIATFAITTVTGGLCWDEYNPVTGKCIHLVYRNVSNDTCCSRGSRFSFTKRDMTIEGVFRAIVTEGGVSRCVPCSSFKGDVCEGINCGRDQYCEARDLQPRCVCKQDCSNITVSGPVCGTNSRDYSNECHLRKARCKKKLDIEVAYRGRCQDSCENVECLVGRCIEDEYGIPRCIDCRQDCQLDERTSQVCGMNNYTYESKCHLRLASCENNIVIGLNYEGRCQDSVNCSTFLCMDGKSCVMDSVPLCFDCKLNECHHLSSLHPFEESKVCGSDNKTYANICEMNTRVCQLRKLITKVQSKECGFGTSSNFEDMFRALLERHSLTATLNLDSNALEKEELQELQVEGIPTEEEEGEEEEEEVENNFLRPPHKRRQKKKPT